MKIFWIVAAIIVVASQGRELQQDTESCPSPSPKWDFSTCKVAPPPSPPYYRPTSPSPSPSPPPPSPPSPSPQQETIVGSVKDEEIGWDIPLPAQPLPSRYSRTTTSNTTGDGGDDGNPFIDPDMPLLVRSAQGGISGGGTIGFKTGGAQDIENFRKNIENGFLPLPTDVLFGGAVKDYYFDTASNTTVPCTELFCPVYSAASTADPLLITAFQGPSAAVAPDLFMAVGLDSGLKESDVKRLPLNLVILVDHSGSMSSPFNLYYYDQLTGQQKNLTEEELKVSKMDVAKEVMGGIIDQLGPDDRVSIVIFDDEACIPLQLSSLPCLDTESLKNSIKRDVQADGGTNFEAGLTNATKVLNDCSDCFKGLTEVENRIILITDAQPNTGDTTAGGLATIIKDNAEKNIFLTVIGVGLDFNTELIEYLGTVKGANYYSVHTPGEFQRRLVQDFNYTVNPLVFDLELSVDPASLGGDGNGKEGWRILSVYGSPNPNDTAYAALGGNGTISRVNTLFPSPKTEEGIKGGVVLLRMSVPEAGANAVPLTLDASYTNRNGERFTTKRDVALPAETLTTGAGPFYQSTGVRKAILLARYTDISRNWLIDEWRKIEASGENDRTIVVPSALCGVYPSKYCPEVSPEEVYGFKDVSGGCDLGSWLNPSGCILPTPIPVIYQLSEWERLSQNLTDHVSEGAKTAFEEFLPYMESEIAALGDSTLNQEVEIVKKIIAAGSD